MKRTAIVTGANRGLGFEASRQLARKGFRVILTSRDEAKGKAAAESLAAEDLPVVFHLLDVTDRQNILKFAQALEREGNPIEVLVNNAGIFADSKRQGNFDSEVTGLNADVELLRKSMETNVYGPFQLSQAIVPLMRKAGRGRIVNVSSGMGQLSEMNGGWPGYRISKTALNAVTRIFSEECKDFGILVNSVCPGWVKTDMGGPGAELSPTEGVDTIVWAATLPDGGPTGGFFREREPIAW
jgi:NAD(P)-dependent dehydrogenase (short-subunit alcohol dehydrogenase family)